MKTAFLFGYFNVGAHADDAIRIATQDMLHNHGWSTIDTSIYEQKMPASGRDIAYFLNSACDRVILCGGSLLGKLRLPPFNTIETWIRYLDIPLTVLGTGWRKEVQRLNPQDIARMQLLIECSDGFYVRGYNSIDYMDIAGLEVSKVKAIGDPGICYNMAPIEKAGGKNLGIVVRQMEDIEKQQDNDTPDNNHIHDQIAKIANFMQSTGWTISFIPMTTKNRAIDNDYKGIESVMKLMPNTNNVFIVDGNEYDIGVRLRSHDLIVSQRLHGSLLAMTQGVPCFPIEYQFNKMADSLSMDEFAHMRQFVAPAKSNFSKTFCAVKDYIMSQKMVDANLKACDTIKQRYNKIISSW